MKHNAQANVATGPGATGWFVMGFTLGVMIMGAIAFGFAPMYPRDAERLVLTTTEHSEPLEFRRVTVQRFGSEDAINHCWNYRDENESARICVDGKGPVTGEVR